MSRYYLKAWADSKEQITTYRKFMKVFKSNLMGVAQERYFYELQNLTSKESNFVKSVIDKSPIEKLRKINTNWLEYYILIFTIEDKIKDFDIINNKTIEEKINIFKKNFEENYHSDIESIGLKYLDFIRAKNINFYYDENSNDRMRFLYYICVQYFRTNNIKQRVINAFKDDQINMNKIYPVMANILATNTAYYLHLNKAMNLVLLINNTNLEFITGDQPVLNTYGVYKNDELNSNELEFYYPISPQLAILVSDKSIEDKIINISDENEVTKYNNFIVHSSYEQIFATNEKTILLYEGKI
ncbi:DUF4238 domain-containing protein [Arcobacter porcinus]|uniref:DUF4238 domain-containing protein n=1 Tax=Arcobacter porcinus TaxID=1935204 RepID=UPI001CDAD5B1|nr:DUF4238 domain-containing protein [Arcobacter porcinus]